MTPANLALIKRARIDLLTVVQTLQVKDPLYEIIEDLTTELEEIIVELSKK